VPPLTITKEEIQLLGRVMQESLDAVATVARRDEGREFESGHAMP